MVTYVVLAKFTDQGIRNAKESPKRAEAFRQLAKTLEVTVKDIFWTQGRYDIVTIVEAPDESAAMSLNFSLGALGNVRTESLRAFSAAEVTTIVGKMIWHRIVLTAIRRNYGRLRSARCCARVPITRRGERVLALCQIVQQIRSD